MNHVIHGTPVPEGRVSAARARHTVEHEHDDDVVVIPPPEVPARRAGREEICGGAMSVAKLAKANGWDVSFWYSRGPYISADARKVLTERAECLVVRGSKGNVGSFDATWLHRPDLKNPGWAFENAWVRDRLQPFTTLDSPNLKRFIRSEETT